MRVHKHTWRLRAIEAMQPGQAIIFDLPKPWGLASIIYKRGWHKEFKLTLKIDNTRGQLTVTKDPEPVRWR